MPVYTTKRKEDSLDAFGLFERAYRAALQAAFLRLFAAFIDLVGNETCWFHRFSVLDDYYWIIIEGEISSTVSILLP